jgi:UV DNA damage endonuclease
MIERIGFCCKWLDENGTTDDKTRNTKSTTVAWLNRQTRADAEQRLWDIMVHNLDATRNLIQTVGAMDVNLRMVRLGSDILPVYTEPSWSYYWHDTAVRAHLETAFARIGELARSLDVRLSFHPGQFTVLASDNPDIVSRSIEEFEYHTDMARWMGYGSSWHDHGFKINVHISGRLGHEGIRAAFPRLSTEARNLITIENEENSHGLSDCLQLADILPIVLDVHHHWCREGEYLPHDHDSVKRVVDSWQGVRPVLHYSVSREDYLVAHDTAVMPDMQLLLETGHKKQKLRAHSDLMWNSAVNDYVLQFADRFDIQTEAKGKNIASRALHEYKLAKTS